jgi:hypothetical protein
VKATGFLKREYGLSDNPFLDDTAKIEWLITWTDREQQVKQWERILSKAVTSRKNFMVFIVGDYGRGKTQSLLKIYEDSKQFPEILAAFLNFKGEEKSKPGLDFIWRIFKSIDFEYVKRRAGKTKLQEGLRSLPPEFDEVKSILVQIFFENENKKLAQYFLRGQIKPTQAHLRKLGILRKIEDIDVAKEYLAGFLFFLKKLGFQSLLLAVDEFEYLFSLVSRSEHNIYLALLRGLYDFPTGLNIRIPIGSLANMVFFIAVSEDGMRRLQEMEKQERSGGGPVQPLMDRIDDTILLGLFDRKVTEELVEKRLKFNRIEGKFEEEPLIPFTEDFVDFIYKKTNGELRGIITICGQVLDAGLEKGASRLDSEFAQKVLEERMPF